MKSMHSIGLLTPVILAAGCSGMPGAAAEDKAHNEEHTGLVSMGGQPVTLIGHEVEVGKEAPDFTAVDAGYQPVTLSSFRGKAVLISAVPSLDTGVCAMQTKRFNEEMAKVEGDVAALTISLDLPFAQKRFCDAEKIGDIQVVSDCVDREFALKYGILIKGRGLLARSIFVVGKDGTLVYKEIVPEITTHPDYDAALEALRKAAE